MFVKLIRYFFVGLLFYQKVLVVPVSFMHCWFMLIVYKLHLTIIFLVNLIFLCDALASKGKF